MPENEIFRQVLADRDSFQKLPPSERTNLGRELSLVSSRHPAYEIASVGEHQNLYNVG